MHNANAAAQRFQVVLDLNNTANVSRYQNVSIGSYNSFRFFCSQVARNLRLLNIVSSCGAATDFRPRQFAQLDLRQRANQLTRLVADVLPIGKMIEIVD